MTQALFSCQSIVLQPTTLCNLNCSYCYLSGRNQNNLMSKLIAEKVARYIRNQNHKVDVIWHGGEPMACGLPHFRELHKPLSELPQNQVRNEIQTNATLINEEWCEFFKKHNFKVGVSLDGPEFANKERVNWAGKSTFKKTLSGIKCLKEHQIDFSVLCVINQSNIRSPDKLYNFFRSIGCSELGFNIEEIEGLNLKDLVFTSEEVKLFWRSVFRRSIKRYDIKIRFIERFISFSRELLNNNLSNNEFLCVDIFPTISWDGYVTFLSPELSGVSSSKYDFNSGNIKDNSLEDLIVEAKKSKYISDYINGLGECRKNCGFFSFCRGGQAANKFFELGTTAGTETTYCKNSKQIPATIFMEEVQNEKLRRTNQGKSK